LGTSQQILFTQLSKAQEYNEKWRCLRYRNVETPRFSRGDGRCGRLQEGNGLAKKSRVAAGVLG